MDKIVEGVSKVFSHLARDIQTYMFAGLIVLGNLYIIDETYYSGYTSYKIFNSDYSILILIIASYIIGQICLGFYTFLLEFWHIDKFLYKYIFKKRFSNITDASEENMIKDKGLLFKANKDAYFHFIERDVNLATLRWNYSSALCICSILNFIYVLFVSYEKFILVTGIVAFFLSWVLMLVHIFTQKETVDHINKLK